MNHAALARKIVQRAIELAAANDDEPKPGPVPREALEYFKSKHLEPKFSFRDVWREEHTVAFTVAKVLEPDILETVHVSLTRALEEGTTFKQWSRDIRGVLDKSGWTAYGSKADDPRRLYTIFATNMRVARAVGQWQRIERTRRTHPYLLYQLGPSERHRPLHEQWAGTLLPVDHPFWTVAFPPNGWGCKCHVRQVSARESDRLGGQTSAPELEEFEYENEGKTHTGYVGIDEGWEYNPGLSASRRLESIQR